MIVDRSDKFKKDFKKLNNPIAKIRLDKVIKEMFKSLDGNLNNMFGDHQLLGDLKEFRELHLDGNCLLVYKIYKDFILLDDIYTHK
nr:MAG TPA: bacterial toxin [Bacteriophage sp.]